MQTVYYGLALAETDRNAARRELRGELKLAADAPLVGMVCRLIEQKGVGYGLRAFALVAPQFPNAHLMIAGDGVLRPALEGEATALGMAERVHFLGWRTDTPTLLAGLDVLLMPSLWEGFGLVMLEAMACGTPTIAFRCGSVPEVLEEGVTGYIVDSIEEAVAVVERLDGFDRARCRAVFEGRFTAERMARNYVEIYRTLCEPSRQRLSEVPVAALGG
jgi:glycosyltransferase involved in cell wall biosynthesis